MTQQAPLSYRNQDIMKILRETSAIAMVGASSRWTRPSYFAMKYLLDKGYKVIPINPREAGSELLGQTVYASLAEAPGPFEMVDIFRNSDAAGETVDEAIALAEEKGIKVVWMQLGVRNDEAAERAEAAGLTVIMDRCPKIEYGRLNTELSWGGFNSRVITAKRRKVVAR